MIKAADAVLQLLKQDEIALESYREGLLNLSAYAEKIQQNVEKLTYKPVKKGTIVVALSRLAKKDLLLPSKPRPQISYLSTRSPVTSFTYPKTSDTERRVSTLNPYLIGSTDLFGIIEGEGEIIIIASDKVVDLIKDHMNVIPKKEVSNLVTITAQFSHAETLNSLSTLLSLFSVHQINLVNVIPSLHEVSFIIDKEDTEKAVAALSLYTAKEKKDESKK